MSETEEQATLLCHTFNLSNTHKIGICVQFDDIDDIQVAESDGSIQAHELAHHS